ncbi:HPr(Ser) kinase/phosphatase [Mycoplasmopsis opalescens]|uniref:HPr(Ser) kinase/phosphatase n=1 Tax=Mycoplasmopsis opalescens TaxID=114886 RepID=UPI0004A76399|nr:HPr(Ser) kinase/phosphatase [Mycoplasmopsis opalescens]
MAKNKEILVTKIIKKFNLDIINKDFITEFHSIYEPAIKRVGLELAGVKTARLYNRNIICWGTNESVYLEQAGEQDALAKIENILTQVPPLMILSKGVSEKVKEWVLKIANKYIIPVNFSKMSTSQVVTSIGTYLSDYFANQEMVHGSLVSVGGVGVLIVGESGSGKSEATLDLVQRGNIFISDDSVLIKQIGSNFYGTSPEITKDFIEVRGIGLIDVKFTYGIRSVTEGSVIHLVVELVTIKDNTFHNFDRLCIEYQKYPILNGSIRKIQIPVKQGFSAASLIEAAVSSYLAKKEGLDIIREINRRKGGENA